jgi:hypothetical protein
MKKIYLEFQKIFKLLFFSIFFVNFNINTYAEYLDDVIEPSCKSIHSEEKFKDLSIFKNIEVSYNQSKFQKKIAVKSSELLQSESEILYLSGQLKKKSNWSTTKINFLDKYCKFSSRVKMTGDLSDHIEYSTNYQKAYSSFLLSIDKDAIMNNSEYKFFLPTSRNFENEVFVANLFSELGFLSPRTAIFKILLNGEKKEFIIQENINKNFLEFNNLKEGLLIEGSEILGLDAAISLANVKNRSWAIRNNDNFRISLKALSYLNQIYFSHSKNIIHSDDPYLETQLFKNKNKKILEDFDALLYSVKAFHANSRNDRRFYFDSIEGNFYPIYYDGMSTILNDPKINLEEIKSLPESVKKGLHRIEEKINKINISTFTDRLKNNGLNLNIKDVKKIINDIRYNIIELKKFKNNLSIYSFSLKKDDLKFIVENTNKLVFSNYDEKKIFFCQPITFNCDQNILRDDHVKLIFPENNYYNPQKKIKLYLGDFKSPSDFFSKYKKKNSFMDYSSKIKIDNTIIFFTKNIDVNINQEKKHIKIINKKNYENRILFYGGSLSGWSIESNSLENKSYNQREKISYFSLTGCITFYKIKLKNINLKINDSYCEDAVNLVYSSGNIKDIEINNSQFDAIDVDFSNILINKVKINYAKNDCIDYSSGTYKINYADLNGCLDKGVSVGEKSNLSVEKLKIRNSKIGIAVKDSSSAKVNIYSANEISQCAMSYRKKKEFTGGELLIKNNYCDLKKFFVQKNSKLEIR